MSRSQLDSIRSDSCARWAVPADRPLPVPSCLGSFDSVERSQQGLFSRLYCKVPARAILKTRFLLKQCSTNDLYLTLQHGKHENTLAEDDLDPPLGDPIEQRQPCLFCSFSVFLTVTMCIAVRRYWQAHKTVLGLIPQALALFFHLRRPLSVS
jgi:hypothetical protein